MSIPMRFSCWFAHSTWHRCVAHLTLGLGLGLAACGAGPNQHDAPGPAVLDGGGGEAGSDAVAPPDLGLPYATHVVSFDPGEGAGFGQDNLPNVVLGPPSGKGTGKGSLDVLSLGKGGSIVLGFERFAIEDGDGPDLLVFENAFWPGGDPSAVYAEPGAVSVSEDGEKWFAFDCDAGGDGDGHFTGCAGVTPTLAYDATDGLPLTPELAGGDGFDLAEIGLKRANFVRIVDVSANGAGPTAGFDLDAVGIVHAAEKTAER